MQKGSDIPQKKFNPKVYFVVGWVMLLAMSLSWSIDNSIVFIFAGSAAYCFFLGFYAMPRNSEFDNSQRSPNFGPSTGLSNISDLLRNIFSKRSAPRPAHARGFEQPAANSAKRRVAPIIFFSIFALFFILILSLIFGSQDVTTEMSDYYNNAEDQYAQGQYDSAYINYRRAWKSDDSNAEAMVGYGNVLAIRNQYDSAALMYDLAFAINPEYMGAAYAKGAMYYNLERFSDCVAIMDPVLRETPDYYDGMLLLGDCYYSLNQYEDAIVWYENAYENGGSRSSALCHLMAYIYDTKGDYSKAISLYQEALEYDSSIVSIYKRLGELLPNEDGNYYRTQAIKLGE